MVAGDIFSGICFGISSILIYLTLKKSKQLEIDLFRKRFKWPQIETDYIQKCMQIDNFPVPRNGDAPEVWVPKVAAYIEYLREKR